MGEPLERAACSFLSDKLDDSSAQENELGTGGVCVENPEKGCCREQRVEVASERLSRKASSNRLKSEERDRSPLEPFFSAIKRKPTEPMPSSDVRRNSR